MRNVIIHKFCIYTEINVLKINLAKFLIASVFINFSCNCNALDSADEKDDLPRVIAPIDVHNCEETAASIRDAMNEDAFEGEHEGYSLGFPEAFIRESIEESEAEKALKIQKQKEEYRRVKKNFIKREFRIRDKALAILSGDPVKSAEYMDFIEKHLYPSIAILELTKDIDAQPRALELLGIIGNYSNEEYQGYFLDRDVGLEASYRIFNYYLEQYNRRATSLTNPKEMDRGVHDLLQLCYTYTPMHPMSGVDDPEHTLFHISDSVNKRLLGFNLWYLNNPKLMKEVIDLRLFTLGISLLQCTTYGVIPKYFDLGFLLKNEEFVGIKTTCLKDKEQYQHVWIHPYMPLQVRITQNGKLTVGLIKKNPLTPDRKLTQRSMGVVDNELYKISAPSLSVSLIPARHKGQQYQELWVEGLERDFKNDLMKEAHSILRLSDMNFEGMERYLCVVSNEGKKVKQKKK